MGATVLYDTVTSDSFDGYSMQLLCMDNSRHPPASDDHHHLPLFKLVSVSCIPLSTTSAYLLKHSHLSCRTCRALPSHHHLRGAPLGRSSSMTSSIERRHAPQYTWNLSPSLLYRQRCSSERDALAQCIGVYIRARALPPPYFADTSRSVLCSSSSHPNGEKRTAGGIRNVGAQLGDR